MVVVEGAESIRSFRRRGSYFLEYLQLKKDSAVITSQFVHIVYRSSGKTSM